MSVTVLPSFPFHLSLCLSLSLSLSLSFSLSLSQVPIPKPRTSCEHFLVKETDVEEDIYGDHSPEKVKVEEEDVVVGGRREEEGTRVEMRGRWEREKKGNM